MIAIGSTNLDTTAKPANLDAQLIAATGCSATEVAGMLAGLPYAGFVATALVPFLAAAPPADLVQQIQAAGPTTVAAAVLALYTTDSVAPEPIPSTVPDDPGAPGTDTEGVE